MQGIHVPFPGDPNNLGKHIVSAFLTVRSPSLVRRSRALGFMLQGTHDIDWTLIRVPRVVDGSPTQAAQTGSLRLGPSSSVTRGDVVALMLDALENRSLVHASPMVSSPRRSARRSPESLPRTVRQAKGHRYRPRTQLGPTSPSPKDPAAA
jgi:hypothetical protein